ncbi:hypothetical protein [Nostoc sp.]|uniref:hypothetical protein n=1 Tax=Nostoc sp. TaxID=1180 RepID=UPI002FFC1048
MESLWVNPLDFFWLPRQFSNFVSNSLAFLATSSRFVRVALAVLRILGLTRCTNESSCVLVYTLLRHHFLAVLAIAQHER